MRTVILPSGAPVPVLGQGTWGMGERRDRRPQEVAALRFGMELGMTLIDTAEMYGEGAAEEIIAEAIDGRPRDEIYLVSKVYPHHADRRGAPAACERSLRRLRTDHLDLYLLHWRGAYPLSETVEAFESLVQAGKIRDWGVSNFDLSDMLELIVLPGGEHVATNQVHYNLLHREIEMDLIPWCRGRHVPIMAYTPIEQGRLLGASALKRVSARHGATPAQVALAWLLQKQEVIVIAKASKIEHVRQNREALDVHLTIRDLEALDQAYPPPRRPTPLKVH